MADVKEAELEDDEVEEAFVPYGQRELIPGPFRCTGGRFRVFVLKGASGQLEEFIRRVLTRNAVRRRSFHPVGDLVMLMIGHTARIASTEQPFCDQGFISEWQASLAIPVIAGTRVAGAISPRRHPFAMAIPYMLVDNPLSLSGGREIYGYPKELGQFIPEKDGDDWRSAEVTVKAFGGNWGKDCHAGWVDLIHVSPYDEKAPGSAVQHRGMSAEHFLTEQLARVGHRVGRSLHLAPHIEAVPWHAVNRAMKGTYRHVLLKQFRSHNKADRSSYTKVVEAPVVMETHSIRPLSKWTVAINQYDSHPVIEELGLQLDKPCDSFELDMDYTIGREKSEADESA